MVLKDEAITLTTLKFIPFIYLLLKSYLHHKIDDKLNYLKSQNALKHAHM